jgi:hypothetical protein
MTGQSHSAVSSLTLPSKVTVIRTAMIGGGLSYDVYVPVSEVSEEKRKAIGYEVWRDGGKYLLFEQATLPMEHFAMPTGWGRYDAWRAHEKIARRKMLDLAESAFPELAKIRTKTDSLPSLWTGNLLYPKPETSDEKTVEVRA